jgi:alpha-galactosidase
VACVYAYRTYVSLIFTPPFLKNPNTLSTLVKPLLAILVVLTLASCLFAAAEPALILTPKPKPEPRINGARIFGVRPGSPFLFRISATGERPMTFTSSGLPEGLRLDANTGIITGTLIERGTYVVGLKAANARGTAERALRIVVGDTIALTPIMGANTYGGWGPFVSEANVRAAADALVKTGLADHGYHYVNIDDGWQGRRGGPYGAIQPNEKFSDMRALTEHLHAMGLRAGIYSTPWTSSYEGFVGGSSENRNGDWIRPNPPRSGTGTFGRYRFEEADARQFAEWGFDYFKYDWALDRPDPELVDRVRRMSMALKATGRDIVFELSNAAPLEQAEVLTALVNMCRTTGDIVDVWDRRQLDSDKQRWAHGVRDIWLQHRHWAPYNRPGHWNMPCPLRVGLLGGWDLKPLQPTRLTPNEQYTHLSLWSLWAAPIIIGCPPERLDEFTLSLLTNDEVIEVNQDPLGRQARQMVSGGHEILIKDLEDGSKAVGLFNVGEGEVEVRVSWTDLGLDGPHKVRDLWRQKDLGVHSRGFAANVGRHGVVFIRIWKQQP